MPPLDPAAAVRRTAYGLLGTLAVAVLLARIAGAENVFEPSRYRPPTAQSYGADRDRVITPTRTWPATRPEPTPMFSSNDRSRWATVKALVEDGTYRIGRRENFLAKSDYLDTGIVAREEYKSLDIVMNPETGEFFSSKPPLLPTLMAGQYWLLNRSFGLSIDHDRWVVIGLGLVTVNVLPFALYLLLLARLIEDHGRSDFGRLFAFAAAALGTFLIPFGTTFSNHVIAACLALFAAYPLLRRGATDSLPALALSGFCAGLAAAVELPAASLAVGLFVPLLIVHPRNALLGYLPAALVPLAALLACNYQAIGQLLPAYGEFGGPWYNFAGSHWARGQAAPSKIGLGLDFADEPKGVYAFHLTFGHHGWFSLTPVWLAAFFGLVRQAAVGMPEWEKLTAPRKPGGPTWSVPTLAALTLAMSAVMLAFVVWRTNNYGGSTSCARWFLWLTPFWLLGLAPAGDWLGRRAGGRALALLLLGLSAFAAFYPAWNPWRAPWILQAGELGGVYRY